MNQYIHIISFDVPYPPNYGGVVDVYFKIKALHEAGAKIILHCFEYGRGKQEKLNHICEEVFYYRRDENKLNFLKKLPYVVASRENELLLERLRKDEHPVLIEGLHNCWLLEALSEDRIKFVRTHNVEHDYYAGLAKVEKSMAKRQYYKWEASKLEKFEEVLYKADMLLAISPNDHAYFNKSYGNSELVPAFHSSEKVTCVEGKGKYALYHGNMAVNENIEAATFLMDKVFSDAQYELIIAGSGIGDELKLKAEQYSNVKLMSNVSVDQLDRLIQEAHVNVLPTFQPTGIKLKLLSALYKGRFAIVNDEMVSNTGLEPTCIKANTAKEWKDSVNAVFDEAFKQEDIDKRKGVLLEQFNNLENAKNLLQRIESLKVVS